ncbi:MAG: hypothetical protein Tsb0013_17960 [Phycisphaerales bacterium]
MFVTEFTPLYFKQLEARRTQRVLEVVDESLRKAAEAREKREQERAERAREAERRKDRLESCLSAIESEESRAVRRTIDRIAGDAQEAADDVVSARERKRQLLNEVRRLDTSV